VAAREGQLAVCETLVAAGADARASTRSGATPLDEARRHRSGEALARLLEDAVGGNLPDPSARAS
jgi:ankyrin repeat protein